MCLITAILGIFHTPGFQVKIVGIVIQEVDIAYTGKMGLSCYFPVSYKPNAYQQ